MRDVLKGILSKKERELIERDNIDRTYYNNEYYDAWAYGNDFVDEIVTEGRILDDTFCIKEFRSRQ
jgi:hypothetical protein